MEIEAIKKHYLITGETILLQGGKNPVFKVGNKIIKKVNDLTFESKYYKQISSYLGTVLNNIEENEFKLSKPIQNKEGEWLTNDKWMVWNFLEGNHPNNNNLPKIINSINQLNHTLEKVTINPILLEKESSAFRYAHHHCLYEKPTVLHPQLLEDIEKLYEKRKPIPDLDFQLIHGDLNMSNIILSNNHVGFIDFTPYVGPKDFSIAMLANFVGPRSGNLDVLKIFEKINHFDQLLIRAGIRMLLIVSKLNRVDDWFNSKESVATQLIIDYVK